MKSTSISFKCLPPLSCLCKPPSKWTLWRLDLLILLVDICRTSLHWLRCLLQQFPPLGCSWTRSEDFPSSAGAVVPQRPTAEAQFTPVALWWFWRGSTCNSQHVLVESKFSLVIQSAWALVCCSWRTGRLIWARLVLWLMESLVSLCKRLGKCVRKTRSKIVAFYER